MKQGSDNTLFAVCAALCLSSVTQGKASVALGLGVTCLVSVTVCIPFLIIRTKGDEKGLLNLCVGVLAACVAAACTAIIAAYLDLQGLEAGVFSSAGAASSVISVCTLGRSSRRAVDALRSATLYFAAVLITGAVRELLGTGQLFGFAIGYPETLSIGALKSSGGGMMISALSAAVVSLCAGTRKERRDGI